MSLAGPSSRPWRHGVMWMGMAACPSPKACAQPWPGSPFQPIQIDAAVAVAAVSVAARPEVELPAAPGLGVTAQRVS